MPATSTSAMTAFSKLALASAAGMRNIANVEALDSWLDKLGATFSEAAPPGADSRAAKSRAWLASVARNWMLRQGALCPYDASPEALAAAPAWIRAATASGRPIQQLALSLAELSTFESILDWMNSEEGPATSASWSKISVSQAEAAELSWIDRKAKAAAKRDLEASEATGTSFFCSGDEPGSSLRWVSVFSKDSLDREGALMRHCVGSYAQDVLNSRKNIYSLRNQDNKPLLTVEARGPRLHQLKAFANAPCPPELMPAVRLFATSFALLHDASSITVSNEIQAAGIIPVPGLGFAMRGEAPPPSWAARIQELLFHPSFDSSCPANDLLPPLAAAGLSSLASLVLPRAWPNAVNQATTLASTHGNLETLDLLLRSLGDAPPSEAIFGALQHGHFECAKRLFSAAAPSEQVGQRALMLAIRSGSLDCVALLMPFAGPSSASFDPLIAAAGSGRLDVLSLIIGACVDLHQSLPRALVFAAANGNVDCIELLLAQGPKGSSIREALIMAAAHDNTDAVRLLLLAAGPQCDTWEALNAAVGAGASLECASALFPQSLMRNFKNPDLGPLLYAIRDDHCDLLSAMLPLYGSAICTSATTLELALCSLQSIKADTLTLVLRHSGAFLDAAAIDSLKKSAQNVKSSIAVDAIMSWLDAREAATLAPAPTDFASSLQARRLDANCNGDKAFSPP